MLSIFLPGRFIFSESLVDRYKGEFHLHETVRIPPEQAGYRDKDFFLVWRYKIRHKVE